MCKSKWATDSSPKQNEVNCTFISYTQAHTNTIHELNRENKIHWCHWCCCYFSLASVHTIAHTSNSKSNKCSYVRVCEVKFVKNWKRKKCLLNQNKKVNFKHSTTTTEEKKRTNDWRDDLFTNIKFPNKLLLTLCSLSLPPQLSHIPVRQTERNQMKENIRANLFAASIGSNGLHSFSFNFHSWGVYHKKMKFFALFLSFSLAPHTNWFRKCIPSTIYNLYAN